MKRSILSLVFATVVSLLLASHAGAAAKVILNVGPDAAGTSVGAGGTIWDGLTLNDVPLAGSGTIVDENGGATSLSVLVTGWSNNPNDGDGKFNTAAATYGDSVARSLFWQRAANSVTVSGLQANTPYTVGLVHAASIAADNQDWTLNGALLGDDVFQTASVGAPVEFTVTANGSGEISIVSTAPGNGSGTDVNLLQAVTLEVIPEPASIALLGMGGLMMLRRRRA